MTTLTPRQLDVVDMVRQFRTSRGISPTLEEIAATFHVTKATAQDYVRTLCDKKVLRRRRYAHRSLEVNESALVDEQSRRLPLVGRVAAGAPIEAIEEREWVDVGDVLGISAARRSLYLLEVKGDSMIDDGIFDGDLVVVEPRQTATNGETVVALLDDGTATLKRFYREKRRIRLQPRNEKLKPIYTRHVTIRGVVTGVVRSLG
ncbi:MAG TPA: transcriptional repressor LexA [Planctomycetota bacterium]|nr:transcriptional repressor LexA [Planctomycetota bacterium]